MQIISEQFECCFTELQASWRFEGKQLNAIEKEQLRRRFTGEISQETYDQWLLNYIKDRGQE